MNIGVVTTWFARGCAYVGRQYEQALTPHHNVFIYARGGPRPTEIEPEWHGPNVHWGLEPVIDMGPTTLDLQDFEAWIQDKKLDWVIFNEQWWMEPLLVCEKLGVRTAAFLVEYKTEQIPLYSAYDLLIAHTRQHYDMFCETHPGTKYIPWGTDVDYFRPVGYDPVQAGLVHFVHAAGSNPPRKGTDLALAAFGRLWDEKVRNIRLLLTSQIPTRQALDEPLISRLEAEGALSYRGPDAPDPAMRGRLAERRDLYIRGDVYLYPSRFDGLGLSVPEATACGLPCITTDFAPMNEFVGPGNGLPIAIAKTYQTSRAHHLFADASIDSLVDRMREMASGFSPDSKKMARAYAEEHFDWRKNASAFPEVFDSGSAIQSPDVKARAMEALRVHEAKNRTGLRTMVGYHFPEILRAVRSTYRSLARK